MGSKLFIDPIDIILITIDEYQCNWNIFSFVFYKPSPLYLSYALIYF